VNYSTLVPKISPFPFAVLTIVNYSTLVPWSVRGVCHHERPPELPHSRWHPLRLAPAELPRIKTWDPRNSPTLRLPRTPINVTRLFQREQRLFLTHWYAAILVRWAPSQVIYSQGSDERRRPADFDSGIRTKAVVVSGPERDQHDQVRF
jgi:hypothetical protein